MEELQLVGFYFEVNFPILSQQYFFVGGYSKYPWVELEVY